MDREKLGEYAKDYASYVALEVKDKTKPSVEVFRKGDPKLQIVSLCTFVSSLAKKNNKTAADLIPYYTNILVKNSKEATE